MPSRNAPQDRRKPLDPEKARAAEEARANAVVVFDPVQAGRDLSAAVETRKPQLSALLGIDAETERGKAMLDRFVTVALHAATSRPDILRATKESIVESIRDAAMLGLEPVGATGDGAIVVYDEKVKVERPGRNGGTIVVEEKVPTARFQPMYRGLLKLARRSDQLAHIDAQIVHEGDGIEIDLGSVASVRHFPALNRAATAKVLGAYAVAELTNGRRYVEWMTYADIELVRRSSRAKDSGPWVSFWGEMARKTVLRRLLKRLPLETMAEHALRIESEAEERAVAPVSQPAETSDARRRLRARFVPELASGEANGAADDVGSTESGADDDPTREAPPLEGTSSRPPGEAEAQESADADVVEGEVKEVEDPPAADQATESAEPTGQCASTSPLSDQGPRCRLEAGHAGPHRASQRETWL